MKQTLLLWVVILSGCQVIPGTDAHKVAEAEGEIRRQMNDPDSAKFGDSNVQKAADGREFVCGHVNAKNAFGGYVGDRPFIYSVADKAVTIPQTALVSSEQFRAATASCDAAGRASAECSEAEEISRYFFANAEFQNGWQDICKQ